MKISKLLLYILSSVLLVFFFFPFALILMNSFKERLDIVTNPLSFPKGFQLDNYFEVYEAMNFSNAVLNSLQITVTSLILIIVFGSMLGYYLLRWSSRLNNFILFMMVSAMIVPFQAIMIPLVNIYGNLGVLNSKWSLAYFYLGFGLSLATFMYHGFMKGVPLELEEAAKMDGASRMKVFALIVFPLLKPITTTIAILDALWIWNDFLLPSLVLITEDARTLPLSTFYFFGQYTSNYGLAMAALVLSIIPIMIFYLIMQKQIIKGVIEGAIK